MSFLDPGVQGTSGLTYFFFQSYRKAESFRSTIELNQDSRINMISRYIDICCYNAFFILFAQNNYITRGIIHLNLCKIATSLLFYKGNEKTVAVISLYR